jgi:hypothetical protein
VSDDLVFMLTHELDRGRPVVELVRCVRLQSVLVPTSFKTDFASIPSPVRWLIPIFGRSCRGAVLHDWLCYRGAERVWRSKLFLNQMLEDGVPAWQAWAQYLAVRWWPGPERQRQ